MATGLLQSFRKKSRFRLYLGFPLFLLLLSFLMFLDPNLGRYLWLQHRKEVIRKEVAEKINDGLKPEKLVLFEVELGETKTRLRWLSSHEFEFNHVLYDVAEVAVEGSTVFLWSWPDLEETSLEKEINQVISRSLGINGVVWEKQDKFSSASRNWPFLLRPGQKPSEPRLISFIFSLLCPDYFCFPLQPPKPPPRYS